MGRQRAYPSDLTDEQWEIIEPMLPLIKEPGRIPKHPFRDIVAAILYLDRSGCSWRQLPVDFPAVPGRFRSGVPSDPGRVQWWPGPRVTAGAGQDGDARGAA